MKAGRLAVLVVLEAFRGDSDRYVVGLERCGVALAVAFECSPVLVEHPSVELDDHALDNEQRVDLEPATWAFIFGVRRL